MPPATQVLHRWEPIAGIAEHTVQHVTQFFFRFFQRFEDEYAFSGSQSVGFQHVRGRQRFEEGVSFGDIFGCDALVTGGRYSQSPKVDKLFIAPGNAGTAQVGTNAYIKADDFAAIKDFVLANDVNMVVVGPEDPLVKGVYDFFKNDASLAGIPVIGPSKAGAQLEGSKDFAKAFMMRHNIPTARYKSITAENIAEGYAFLESVCSLWLRGVLCSSCRRS